MTALLAIALITLLAAGLLDGVAGVAHAPLRPLPYLLAAAASGLLVVVGAAALGGTSIRLGLDAALGEGAWTIGEVGLLVDPLAGLFLVISFGVAVPVCCACAAWAAHPGRVRTRGVAAAHCLCLGAVALVTTADNAFLFLMAWELLTVSFYLLTGFARRDAQRADAAVITVVAGRVSGAALLLGMLLLAGQAHSVEFTQFALVPQSGLRDAAFSLLVVGFSVKIGLVPLHVWMPRGYWAAPGPLRGVLAGVAVNVGFYGLWRVLDLLHRPPGWLSVALLLLGSITAVLGISHAAVHTDLIGVVAYSSVENAGLITVGYAVALVGAAVDQAPLVAVGLLAASLQVVTHALAKALLFCAVAGIEDTTGTTEMEQLRGVGRLLPGSAAGLAVGAVTLAGLPLTAGFVSEWFLLEALMQQFRLHRLDYALPMALAGALVALTTGFAAVAFLRVVGFIAFGAPSSSTVSRSDRHLLRPASTLMLAAACIGVAAVAPAWIRVVAAGLAPVVPSSLTREALQSAWVVQPVYPEFSALSPSWLVIVMPVMLAGALALCAFFSRNRMFTVRRVPAWRSAAGGVVDENQYTPFGFANPTRKVLANVLLTRSELTVLEQETGGRTGDPQHGAAGAHLGYTVDVIEVVERFMIRPISRTLLRSVRIATRLQNGRLDAYLAYMLLAVLAVLAVVAALS